MKQYFFIIFIYIIFSNLNASNSFKKSYLIDTKDKYLDSNLIDDYFADVNFLKLNKMKSKYILSENKNNKCLQSEKPKPQWKLVTAEFLGSSLGVILVGSTLLENKNDLVPTALVTPFACLFTASAIVYFIGSSDNITGSFFNTTFSSSLGATSAALLASLFSINKNLNYGLIAGGFSIGATIGFNLNLEFK